MFLNFIALTQATMLLVIFLIVAIYIFFKKRYKYWEKRGVYAPKPTIPLGNIPWSFSRWFSGGCTFEDVYKDVKARSEPYGGYYFLTRPFLILIDLNMIKKAMVTDFEYFSDRVFQPQENDPLSRNLLSLSGDEWKTLRSKLTPAFTLAKTKLIFSNFVESSEDLLHAIDRQVAEGELIELKEIMMNFTIDVIVKSVFGIKSTTLKDRKSDFKDHGIKYFDTSLKSTVIRFLFSFYPQVLAFFKIPMFGKDVTSFFIKLATDVINMRENYGMRRIDLMHLLLQIRNHVELDGHTSVKSNKNEKMSLSLSTNDIAAQCYIFFLAGYETTSTALSMCLYELSLHQDIQERARREVNACLETSKGEFTYDVLQDMTYLERCLKEGLRKHPPQPTHTRKCTKTYRVPETNLVIEKGTEVIVPALAIHRDSDYYVNPEEFDPDRFEGGTPEAWMPFGGGPKSCIGINFAWSEIKLVLAIMLKTYKLSLHPKTEVPLRYDSRTIVLRSIGGLWVNVEKI